MSMSTNESPLVSQIPVILTSNCIGRMKLDVLGQMITGEVSMPDEAYLAHKHRIKASHLSRAKNYLFAMKEERSPSYLDLASFLEAEVSEMSNQCGRELCAGIGWIHLNPANKGLYSDAESRGRFEKQFEYAVSNGIPALLRIHDCGYVYDQNYKVTIEYAVPRGKQAMDMLQCIRDKCEPADKPMRCCVLAFDMVSETLKSLLDQGYWLDLSQCCNTSFARILPLLATSDAIDLFKKRFMLVFYTRSQLGYDYIGKLDGFMAIDNFEDSILSIIENLSRALNISCEEVVALATQNASEFYGKAL